MYIPYDDERMYHALENRGIQILQDCGATRGCVDVNVNTLSLTPDERALLLRIDSDSEVDHEPIPHGIPNPSPRYVTPSKDES